jgi:hypothetical protein
VRSQDVAEDIVQDLFLTLWITRSELAWKESPRGYLFAAARTVPSTIFATRHWFGGVRPSRLRIRLTGTGPAPPLPDHLAERPRPDAGFAA